MKVVGEDGGLGPFGHRWNGNHPVHPVHLHLPPPPRHQAHSDVAAHH